MAWQENHKAQSRIRILDAAGDLFTRKGFDKVGIDEVMQAAGMTRGAFYAHFSSKFELYEEAILRAGKQAAQHFMGADANREEFVGAYLSKAHMAAVALRCPLPCLVSDVAHGDERVRGTYTLMLKGFIAHMSRLSAEDPEVESSPEKIIQQVVLLIGGMALSRSVSDEKLAAQILAACGSSTKNMV
ncbi:MAG: TetR/AcrR family transcriptional regulator [Pseudomonadota bacterium]